MLPDLRLATPNSLRGPVIHSGSENAILDP